MRSRLRIVRSLFRSFATKATEVTEKIDSKYLQWALSVPLFACVGYTLHSFAPINWGYAVGWSMYPTIVNSDWIIYTQVWLKKLKPGDIIIVAAPNSDKLVCKRVIGVPGDSIVFPGSGTRSSRPTKGTITVPSGHIWVLGDNRSNSRDSREYGFVPINLCFGKVKASLDFQKFPPKIQYPIPPMID
eukprot:TRINITY_DN20493_c0_g1_i1.p1 TRINITY_DN20493_c0_g1~~TRINITY_DN20493_c0_g1_i1.p1  ORF type:complete len:187 (+),score=13.03 TRINITY_DN20493_c0_g1_i1:59-619(+)